MGGKFAFNQLSLLIRSQRSRLQQLIQHNQFQARIFMPLHFDSQEKNNNKRRGIGENKSHLDLIVV